MKNTSIEAYKKFEQKINTDEQMILSVLDNKEPLTYKEIGRKIYKKILLLSDAKKRLKAYSWKYDPNKVSRRMKKLVENNLVKELETRKCTIANSKCTTYIKTA